MHSFLCFSKIGFLHDIDLYLGLLSLENCDFDSKQLSLPVAISACRAAPMGANPLGHTFKPLTLYDISIYTIYFSHPIDQIAFDQEDLADVLGEETERIYLCGKYFVVPARCSHVTYIGMVLVRKWVGEGQRDSKFQEFTSLMVWQ